jgi:hypothetical protein
VLAATLVEDLGENKYGFSMRVSMSAMAYVRLPKNGAAAITAAANSG